MIYDPATGDRQRPGRTPFPDNIVPLSRQSSIARKLLSICTPLPNQPGDTATTSIPARRAWTATTTTPRSTGIRTDRHSPLRQVQRDECARDGRIWPGRSRRTVRLRWWQWATRQVRAQLATIGYTWTLSPQFLWDGVLAGLAPARRAMPHRLRHRTSARRRSEFREPTELTFARAACRVSTSAAIRPRQHRELESIFLFGHILHDQPELRLGQRRSRHPFWFRRGAALAQPLAAGDRFRAARRVSPSTRRSRAQSGCAHEPVQRIRCLPAGPAPNRGQEPAVVKNGGL